MKTIKVKITKDIIEHAVVRDSNRCMIADALHATLPKVKYISVDLQSVKFTDKDIKKRFVYFTPVNARDALLRFDKGLPVKPFTIRLKDGVVKKAGLHATHPNWDESKRKRGVKLGAKRGNYKKSGQPRLYPKRDREFGFKKLQ